MYTCYQTFGLVYQKSFVYLWLKNIFSNSEPTFKIHSTYSMQKLKIKLYNKQGMFYLSNFFFFVFTKITLHNTLHTRIIIGIVHPQITFCWKCSHPQTIQDVDEFVFIRTNLEKLSITSLAHQWILCSEWVPSEWEFKLQRIHWWPSDLMPHFSKSDEETNSSMSWKAREW